MCEHTPAVQGAGLAVELERWDAADGKGIDDLLAAGKVPELLRGMPRGKASRKSWPREPPASRRNRPRPTQCG
jgi:hypothetical protein